MSSVSAIAVAVAALALAACASDEGRSPIASDTNASAADEPEHERPSFVADFGDAGPDGAAADASSVTWPPVDPSFHARIKEQIRGIVRDDYAKYDWDALLTAKVPFSGVKIWIPGTGGRVADDSTNGRAMGSVPAGFASGGAAIAFAGVGPSDAWVGLASSQAIGGARFAERGSLSALEVFDTAWPDAQAILAALGPHVKGAWLVGHSAGANPAMLAGVVGGAARVDVYGVPSAVGRLDDADGLAHFHTHPLDPTATMGKIGATGNAELDLLGAFVTTVKAGGTLAYHDYRAWPAPAP